MERRTHVDVGDAIRDRGDIRVPAAERIVLVLAPEVAAGVAPCNVTRNVTWVTVDGPFPSADGRTTLTHHSRVPLSGP